jgi:hypothetical protein
MHVADAFGYPGSVVVLLGRPSGAPAIGAEPGNALTPFVAAGWTATVLSLAGLAVASRRAGQRRRLLPAADVALQRRVRRMALPR